jgi:hypothetical protein
MDGHSGINNTLAKVSQYYIWNGFLGGCGFIYLFIYLLTSAVNRNINIYKQEDGSGTLTQRDQEH